MSGNKQESDNSNKRVNQLKNSDAKCVDFTYIMYEYGRFHNNWINQLIHLIFVPIIIYTLNMIVQHYVTTFNLPFEMPLTDHSSEVSISILIYLFLSSVFLVVDIPCGLVCTVWFVVEYVIGNWEYKTYKDAPYCFGLMTQLQYMATLHVVGWLTQFVGHGLFEQRAPAVLTNIFFAILAPFFVTFEALNYCFGYKEGPRMQKVLKLIQEDIIEYKSQK